MAWIELHEQVRDHWKITRLAEQLGVRYAEAVGLVVNLWLWAALHAKTGDLGRFTEPEIARAARYEPTLATTNGKLMDALKSCELLEENGQIHDWEKHGLKLLASTRKRVAKCRRNAKRQQRYGNVTDTLPQRNSNAVPNRTLPDLTGPNQDQELNRAQGELLRFLTTTKPLTTIRNPERFVRHLTAAYPADWTLAELKKLMAWLAANPLREAAMRDWDRFVTNWLKKGWGDPLQRAQVQALTAKIGVAL